MDKRDKRVVGAAVAAAIIIAIAILGAGWFFASRDDAGSQAVSPAPAVPAPATAESDSGRTARPQSAGTATPAATNSPTAQAPSSQASAAVPTGSTETGVAGTETPSPGQPATAGRSDPPPGAGQPAVTGQPGQLADSGVSGPAAGSATGNLLASPETAATPPAQATAASPTPAAPAAPVTSARPTGNVATTPPAGRSVLSEEQVAALPSIRPPSFDVVRVNELGDAVIAGRAEPRSVVIIYDGDREIGRVAADGRGEWVFVSDRPLIPGQHEIGLLSRSGPQSRLSDQVVVLIAPEPRQDIAGQPTEGDADREKPLALLVPRDEIGATTVLQSPPAVVTERATDDPASRPGRPAIASTTTTAPTVPSGNAAPSTPTTSGTAPVSIDVVDYDEAGQLIVSGRSTPQSDVRLYLDNEYVGTARAGTDGSFHVQPAEPVEPGVYALRIDEVSPVGSVTARAETPFQRANEVAAIPGYSRIVVQPGNSLWRLARRVYGQGIQYTVIYQANTGQIRNPDLIYPGQIFNVPEMPTDVPAGDPS